MWWKFWSMHQNIIYWTYSFCIKVCVNKWLKTKRQIFSLTGHVRRRLWNDQLDQTLYNIAKKPYIVQWTRTEFSSCIFILVTMKVSFSSNDTKNYWILFNSILFVEYEIHLSIRRLPMNTWVEFLFILIWCLLSFYCQLLRWCR